MFTVCTSNYWYNFPIYKKGPDYFSSINMAVALTNKPKAPCMMLDSFTLSSNRFQIYIIFDRRGKHNVKI